MNQQRPDPAAPTGAATLVIGQRVRPGRDDDYRRWCEEVGDAVARSPGFRGVELRPPTAVQTDWLAVYRFDSVAHVQRWLNSAARQRLISRGAAIFDGPGTQQVISRGGAEEDTLVTVVLSHRVAEHRVEEFLAWQQRLTEAQRGFAGYRGSEVFRPIAGVQDEWTIFYRFDTAGHLDSWLTSEERRTLLADADFGDFTMRTIDHSFGAWFSDADTTAPPPSDFKTSIAVWVGLYPTVMMLTLLTAPLGMPLWLGLLIGNLLSSFVMSYATMPYYVRPLLGWWLRPRPGGRRFDARALLLVVGVNAVWAAVFFVLTVRGALR